MKLKDVLVAVAAIAFATSVSMAQPPQGGPPPGGHGGGPPSGGGHPILGALDADQNQELSSAEINNATKVLKAMDKNGDGVLNMEDFGSMGGPPGGGRRGGGPGGRGGRRGGDADTGEQVNDFASRLLAFDKNKNGKVEKDELPIRMQRVMDNIDANKDGVLDKSELDELKAAAKEAASSPPSSRSGERGGSGGRRSGPPGGGERGGPPGGGLPGGGGGSDRMIDHAFEFDKNKDGKLSREELTEFANSMSHGPPGGHRDLPDAENSGRDR